MPIYVLRLDNGITLIGEAASKKKAHKKFLRELKIDHDFARGKNSKEDVRGIWMHELPKNSFLSQWHPAPFKAGPVLPGTLEGRLCSPVAGDILADDYPLIAETHSQDVPEGGSAFDRWMEELEKSVEEEMSRAS